MRSPVLIDHNVVVQIAEHRRGGRLDGHDPATNSNRTGREQRVVADVRTDVDEKNVAVAESACDETGQVRFPLLEDPDVGGNEIR